MIRNARRTLLAALTAAAGLAAPGVTHAQHSSCRSDPTVTISNLGTLDLSASIGDSLSDVQRVAYVVHVPAGSRVLATLNTDGLIGLKETVRVYADNPANTFDTVTTVYTGTSAVPVTASTILVSPLNLALGVASASGLSGQPLQTHFSRLL